MGHVTSRSHGSRKVLRRYNEFSQLRQALLASGCAPPELPEPRGALGGLWPDSARAKRQQLRQFLDAVLAADPQCADPVLRRFLGLVVGRRSHLSPSSNVSTNVSSLHLSHAQLPAIENEDEEARIEEGPAPARVGDVGLP